MADAPFDRTIIQFRERPVSVDINQAQSQIDRALRFVLQNLFEARASDLTDLGTAVSGFIGDSLRVRPSSGGGMNVDVTPGAGFLLDGVDVPSAIGGVVGLDDLSPYKPSLLLATHTFPVPTAPIAPDTRVDIVEVKVDRRTENPQVRNIFNSVTGDFDPTLVDKTLAFALDGRTGSVVDPAPSTAGLSYKVGIAGNPPVTPAVTPGYVKIAEVNVGSGVLVILPTDLVDRRKLLAAGNVQPVAAQFRVQFNGGGGLESITMRNVLAPPGMHVVARAVATRGEGEVTVLGGEFSKIVGSLVGHPPSIIGVGQMIQCYLRAPLGIPSVLGFINAAEQAALLSAQASPNVSVGVGTRRAEFTFQSRFQSAGVTNNTDPLLEDLEMHFAAWVGW